MVNCDFKALIIDDDNDSCDVTRLILSSYDKYKFIVDECKTLKEALKLNLNKYDIIILDMVLPDSEGVYLYKTISSSTSTPILIYSGYPDLALEAAKAGAQAYLTKPVSRDVLIQTIIFSIEKYRLKNKIEKEEKKFKMVIEGISDSIIICETTNGKDFIIINMNKSAEKLEKVKREDVIGKNIMDVFPYIKKFNFDKIFEEVYKTGISKEDDLKFYDDGTWRTNYIFKLPSDEIVDMCYDKTKIMQMIKELEEKERMLRCSFNFNRDIIFITDESGNIIDRNRSFNKYLKYHHIEDKEINEKILWKDKKERNEFLKILKEKGQNLNKEVIFLSKNGNELYCIISAYVLDNKIYYFIHDVTREKKSYDFMSKSSNILSEIMESKIDKDLDKELKHWKEEEDVRIVLRKEKIKEIDSILKDIKIFSGEK